MNTVEIVATAMALTALFQVATHYFPWNKWFGKKLCRPAAYTVGILGIGLGILVLFLGGLISVQVLILLGLVVIAAGGPVLALYAMDGFYETRAQRDDWKDRAECQPTNG